MRIVAWDGRVSGADASASSNTTPRAARRVEGGRRARRAAIGAHAVGAQRVERDEQHARPRRPSDVRPAGPPTAGGGDERQQRGREAASRRRLKAPSPAARATPAAARRALARRQGPRAPPRTARGPRSASPRARAISPRLKWAWPFPGSTPSACSSARFASASRPSSAQAVARPDVRDPRCGARSRSLSEAPGIASRARPARSSASASRKFTSGLSGSSRAMSRVDADHLRGPANGPVAARDQPRHLDPVLGVGARAACPRAPARSRGRAAARPPPGQAARRLSRLSQSCCSAGRGRPPSRVAASRLASRRGCALSPGSALEVVELGPRRAART